MSTTPDTGLPLLDQQQAQPEVTHNEAVTLLAALQNGAISLTNTPPASPTVGDSYLCGASPTGAWAGHANAFAAYTYGGWRFFPGRDSAGAYIDIGARHAGVRIWVRDLGLHLWNGIAWSVVLNGRLAKAMSDANTTLTAAESANDILEFSGTLTATRNIVVPLVAKQWTVFNGTGQSLQFIGATGAGITVAAGKRAILYANGTNVVRVTADV